MVSAARWNLYSRFYNLMLKSLERERARLYRSIPLDNAHELYIAGCGTGLDFPYLPADCRIQGVDFSDKMLAQAKQLADELRLNVQLTQARAECSGLADNSQDLVLLHLILAVTDAPRPLLEEAVRVVKPGGVISLWDKFLPEGQRPSLLRRGLDKAAQKIATSINLQIEPLLTDLPVRIIHREYRLAKFMQHIILQKQ